MVEWRLVPAEASEAMEDAFTGAQLANGAGFADCYAAMLSAAPSAAIEESIRARIEGLEAQIAEIPTLCRRYEVEVAELRTARDGLRETLNSCERDYSKVRAQRDSLREALKGLMKSTGALYNSQFADNEAEAIARAALETE